MLFGVLGKYRQFLIRRRRTDYKMATPPEDGYDLVCSLRELQGLGRKRVALNERVVVLFHVKEKLYALDHFCYRKKRYCVFCVELGQ